MSNTQKPTAAKSDLVVDRNSKELVPRQSGIVPGDLSSTRKVSAFLARLMPATRGDAAAAAIVPWMCDVLPSNESRIAYGRDLATFQRYLDTQGHRPLGPHSSRCALLLQASGRRSEEHARKG